MGRDLNLANRIWWATRWYAQRQKGLGALVLLDYYSVVMAVSALLESKELAQELVDESWEEDGDSPEVP
jgi:hypothetical protein